MKQGQHEVVVGEIYHNTAELFTGCFLVYVSRRYKTMVVALKGLHLSFNFLWADWEEDGWRNANTIDCWLEVDSILGNAPRKVQPVPHLAADMAGGFENLGGSQDSTKILPFTVTGTYHLSRSQAQPYYLSSQQCLQNMIWDIHRVGHTIWRLHSGSSCRAVI